MNFCLSNDISTFSFIIFILNHFRFLIIMIHPNKVMAHTSKRRRASKNIDFNMFPSAQSAPTGGNGGFFISFDFWQKLVGIGEGNQIQTFVDQEQAVGQTHRVSFNNVVKVILIPTREEFRQAKISEQLWWNYDSDFALFKRSACRELRHFMMHHKLECHKEALRLLYQTGGPDEQEEGDLRGYQKMIQSLLYKYLTNTNHCLTPFVNTQIILTIQASIHHHHHHHHHHHLQNHHHQQQQYRRLPLISTIVELINKKNLTSQKI